MPTTRLEDLADCEGGSCMFRRDGDDLPATAVMTANAGSRSFWANIVMELCCSVTSPMSAQLNWMIRWRQSRLHGVEKTMEAG
jgi:hypothetical protein